MGVIKPPIKLGLLAPPDPPEILILTIQQLVYGKMAYYAWNPVTGQTSPLTPQSYSYNPSTGMWDTTQYVFDPTTDSYQPNVVGTPSLPAGAVTTDSPVTDNAGSSSSIPNTSATNPISTSTNNNGFFNNFYNATVAIM